MAPLPAGISAWPCLLLDRPHRVVQHRHASCCCCLLSKYWKRFHQPATVMGVGIAGVGRRSSSFASGLAARCQQERRGRKPPLNNASAPGRLRRAAPASLPPPAKRREWRAGGSKRICPASSATTAAWRGPDPEAIHWQNPLGGWKLKALKRGEGGAVRGGPLVGAAQDPEQAVGGQGAGPAAVRSACRGPTARAAGATSPALRSP